VTETYESIKTKLEGLIRERQKLTDELMNNKNSNNTSMAADDEDELDAYMNQTLNQLKIEQ
jgi:hypothetical protein